jgi:hypothetical protein
MATCPAAGEDVSMISEHHNERAATPNAEQLAIAARSLRHSAAGPDALQTMPATLAHVGDAVDELASSMLVLAETMTKSSDLGTSLDLDHLPPEARSLSWHLHELAARLRAARASVATARHWAHELGPQRARAPELAIAPGR